MKLVWRMIRSWTLCTAAESPIVPPLPSQELVRMVNWMRYRIIKRKNLHRFQKNYERISRDYYCWFGTVVALALLETCLDLP